MKRVWDLQVGDTAYEQVATFSKNWYYPAVVTRVTATQITVERNGVSTRYVRRTGVRYGEGSKYWGGLHFLRTEVPKDSELKEE